MVYTNYNIIMVILGWFIIVLPYVLPTLIHVTLS